MRITIHIGLIKTTMVSLLIHIIKIKIKVGLMRMLTILTHLNMRMSDMNEKMRIIVMKNETKVIFMEMSIHDERELDLSMMMVMVMAGVMARVMMVMIITISTIAWDRDSCFFMTTCELAHLISHTAHDTSP